MESDITYFPTDIFSLCSKINSLISLSLSLSLSL